MHTLMRTTTSTEATSGAKRRSVPMTATRSFETHEGTRKKGAANDSQEYINVPTAAASSPQSKRTAQQTQHLLKDSNVSKAAVESPQPKRTAQYTQPGPLAQKILHLRLERPVDQCRKNVENARDVSDGRQVRRYSTHEQVTKGGDAR